MLSYKRILAAVMTASLAAATAVSCSNKNSENNSNTDITTAATEPVTEPPEVDMNITWLSDYDLNPTGSNERSAALALFEEYCGGTINYIAATPDEKFTKLAAMLNAGEEVDMFPYEPNAVPYGVLQNQFEPLDPYFDILEKDTALWNDMNSIIDMFEYNGQHYVIPYSVSDPLVITYSRKIMKSEGLEDPYELYKKGEWNWDTFMEMMETFVANTPEGYKRYGINGWFGKAVFQSTGHTIINYKDGRLTNNINDKQIEKAGLLLQDIAEKQLCAPEMAYYFPADHSTLFFAMEDWSLGVSNAMNEDMDLMVVPFPKSPESDSYYLSCTYNARMLVKNSKKGEAVANYIRCERLAATEKSYLEEARKNALVVHKTDSGLTRSFVTGEQYDALQEYMNPKNVKHLFDFGYGMGEKMYGSGAYSYETRGVMNNLTQALLESEPAVESWSALRDAWKGVIDEEIAKFNP